MYPHKCISKYSPFLPSHDIKPIPYLPILPPRFRVKPTTSPSNHNRAPTKRDYLATASQSERYHPFPIGNRRVKVLEGRRAIVLKELYAVLRPKVQERILRSRSSAKRFRGQIKSTDPEFRVIAEMPDVMAVMEKLYDVNRELRLLREELAKRTERLVKKEDVEEGSLGDISNFSVF